MELVKGRPLLQSRQPDLIRFMHTHRQGDGKSQDCTAQPFALLHPHMQNSVLAVQLNLLNVVHIKDCVSLMCTEHVLHHLRGHCFDHVHTHTHTHVNRPRPTDYLPPKNSISVVSKGSKHQNKIETSPVSTASGHKRTWNLYAICYCRQ